MSCIKVDAIIVGFKGKFAAFILAGLTLVISIYMHDFWTMTEGMERAHETQNFFKNMNKKHLNI